MSFAGRQYNREMYHDLHYSQGFESVWLCLSDSSLTGYSFRGLGSQPDLMNICRRSSIRSEIGFFVLYDRYI